MITARFFPWTPSLLGVSLVHQYQPLNIQQKSLGSLLSVLFLRKKLPRKGKFHVFRQGRHLKGIQVPALNSFTCWPTAWGKVETWRVNTSIDVSFPLSLRRVCFLKVSENSGFLKLSHIHGVQVHWMDWTNQYLSFNSHVDIIVCQVSFFVISRRSFRKKCSRICQKLQIIVFSIFEIEKCPEMFWLNSLWTFVERLETGKNFHKSWNITSFPSSLWLWTSSEYVFFLVFSSFWVS